MRDVPLLSARQLNVRLRTLQHRVLEDIGFDIAAGETVGVLGASGAGKTTLARALMRLLNPRTYVQSGSICFRGAELMEADERALGHVRGAQISLISQEPELALSPVMPVSKQVDEVLRAHSPLDGHHRRAQVEEMLPALDLPAPTYRAY